MQQIAILMWVIVIGFVSLGSVVLMALATIKRDLAQRDRQLQEHLNDLTAMRVILERAWSLSRAKDTAWR